RPSVRPQRTDHIYNLEVTRNTYLISRSQAIAHNASEQGPRRKVLVVEDDASWARRHSSRLQRLGIDHIVVDNVADAIERIRRGGITEVVTDGMEGGWIDIANAAREHGVTPKVVSADSDAERLAGEKQIRFLNKWDASEGLEQFLRDP